MVAEDDRVVVAPAAAARARKVLGDTAAGQGEAGVAQGAGEGGQAVLDRLPGGGEVGAEFDMRLRCLRG